MELYSRKDNRWPIYFENLYLNYVDEMNCFSPIQSRSKPEYAKAATRTNGSKKPTVAIAGCRFRINRAKTMFGSNISHGKRKTDGTAIHGTFQPRTNRQDAIQITSKTTTRVPNQQERCPGDNDCDSSISHHQTTPARPSSAVESSHMR